MTERIVSRISSCPIQFIIGGGCSGKTYILTDIACKVRDRDVFLFETRDRLSDSAFQSLLRMENSLVLADSNTLSYSQIEIILDSISDLKKRNLHIIISTNRHDSDLNGQLKLREKLGVIQKGSIPQYEIKSKLEKNEEKTIAPLLTATELGVYRGDKTIVDNIIDIGEYLKEKNRYSSIDPNFKTTKDIATLVAIATEKKIYSYQVISLDLYDNMLQQIKITRPLLDSEVTWTFEKSVEDNSPVKYVVNAEYWLIKKLSEFSKNDANKIKIADAYKYIISKQIEQYGSPDILYGNNRSSYRDYIKFDNINRIFCSDNSSGANGLALIRTIYESLNTMLSVDPNYMHQRAKCYIKSAQYETDKKIKLEYLDKAYRDANIAMQIFTQRYDNGGSEKLLISIAHVTYTMALIWCHRCKIEEYEISQDNTFAVQTLHKAMISPYNSYDYAKVDSFNYNNVIKQMVANAISDSTLVENGARNLLSELFGIIS